MLMNRTEKIHVKKRFACILIILLCVVPALSYSQIDTIETHVPSLKDVYAHDFTIGCILSYRHVGFPDDPPVPGQSAVVAPHGGDLVKFHMNSMSPGNNMKPENTVDITACMAAYNAASPAEKDSVDTHPVVRFKGDLIAQLNWAQRQGFTFHGHVLVWHSQTPAAFFRSGYGPGGARLSKEKMTQRMDYYLKEVIRLIHEGWPGLLSAMDVVNEAVTDNGADRTTGSEWYTTFGDNSYVMKAFEIVRKYSIEYGETQMKLYYNDYNTHNAAKADGIVRLCTPIYQAGFLDGIGIQDHDALSYPTAEEWSASYNKFAPICTEMSVTELDVMTGSATPSPSVLASQANQYGQLFKCYVERSAFSGRGKIVNVSKDGLNDQWTFKTNQSSSLWDMYNKCKPAFFAVAGVGSFYNQLDSLILYASALQEGDYTAESWAPFASALALAQNAMSRNYSASNSASDALGGALDALQGSILNLVQNTGVSGAGEGRASFTLEQNYPNPFNQGTEIRYSVPGNASISLKVYTLRGEEVVTLFEGEQSAGSHTASLDCSTMAGGIYMYRLQAGNALVTKKFILVK